MDRIIQPYAGPHAAVPARPATSAVTLPPTAIPKTSGDFARALRRRGGLVLLVAAAVIIPGSVFVVRQAAVYRATAEILVEPPRFDATLASIIAHSGVGGARDENEKYVPNRLARLRNKDLAFRVTADPRLGTAPRQGPDQIAELLDNLTTRPYPGTNYFEVSLEGGDPERVTRLLTILLEEFSSEANAEHTSKIDESILFARNSLKALDDDLKRVDDDIRR